jgi:hypothetical protein
MGWFDLTRNLCDAVNSVAWGNAAKRYVFPCRQDVLHVQKSLGYRIMKQFVAMTDEMLFQHAALGEKPVPYQYGLHCLHQLGTARDQEVASFVLTSVAACTNSSMLIDESSTRLPA